ncbi:hypothetical protein ACO0LB_20315 [Undibacterium sp. SXout7W]|uniref:hypothetical protein n=1 Tax=Undibacterium sp. SXout7W TaxID=3413049 RepID=UPI003BF3950A
MGGVVEGEAAAGEGECLVAGVFGVAEVVEGGVGGTGGIEQWGADAEAEEAAVVLLAAAGVLGAADGEVVACFDGEVVGGYEGVLGAVACAALGGDIYTEFLTGS